MAFPRRFSAFAFWTHCWLFTAFSAYAAANPIQTMSIDWPLNTINLSQLENIFLQNPAFKQFTVLFPNHSSWTVTPPTVQTLLGSYQAEAKSLGFKDKLPDLSFSSLGSSGFQASGSQLPIDQLSAGSPAALKSRMDDLLRQARYRSLNLGDFLPDWLKRLVVGIYDAANTIFDFLSAKFPTLFTR